MLRSFDWDDRSGFVLRYMNVSLKLLMCGRAVFFSIHLPIETLVRNFYCDNNAKMFIDTLRLIIPTYINDSISLY